MKLNEWNFGDEFPSIEIDTEVWKKLSFTDKLKYLKQQLLQEKDFGNRINLINFILGTSAKIGRSLVKQSEYREYFDVIDNAAGLISIVAAVGNICKAKQSHRVTKNNEIAQLMGYPNGDYVDTCTMNVTYAMIDTLMNITDFNQSKYKIKIEKIITGDDGHNKEKATANNTPSSSDEDESLFLKNVKIIGTLDDKEKWGLIIKAYSSLFDDDGDSTHKCECKLVFPNTGNTINHDDLRDKLMNVLYALYIEKVDIAKNYVKIKGSQLEICKRVEINADIKNVDINRLIRGMKKVLNEGLRRAVVLIGEPGTGKTICVHKVTNEFKDRLVFWVSPDSIDSVDGIRNVFKVFNMFKNSIIIFDDLDSAPFTGKDEITGEFISYLDGTNNSEFTGFIIATVNDPSKLHSTLLNRPERIDDVMYAYNPKTRDEITDIIFLKANERNFYPKCEYDNMKSLNSDKEIGLLDVNKTDDSYLELCDKILAAKFTQVQVAGLISYCYVYNEQNVITLSLLNDAFNARVDSISNANKVAIKGGKLIDSNSLSTEATAALSKSGKMKSWC